MNIIKNKNIGLILSYVLLLLDCIIGIFYTPLLLNSLGTTQYGLYDLVNSFANYIAIVDIGLGATVTRYIIKYKTIGDKEKEQNSIKTAIFSYLFLMLIAFIIGILATLLLPQFLNNKDIGTSYREAQLLMLVMSINISLSLFIHAFSGIALAYSYYSIEKILKIFRLISRFILVIVIVTETKRALSIAIIDVILTLIMILSYLLFFKICKISLFKGKFSFYFLKKMLVFTIFILFQSLINQINTGAGKIIIGWREDSTKIITTYSIISQLYLLYCNMSSVVQNIYYPSISTAVFKGENVNKITNRIVYPSRIQLMILQLIIIGFMFFGLDFLKLWIGNQDGMQIDKIWILSLLLMLTSFIYLCQNTITCILKAKNKLKERTIILGIGAFFNILFSIIFSFIIDSVYSVVIGLIVSNIIFCSIIMNIYYKKYGIINVKSFFRETFSRQQFVIFLSIVIGFLLNILFLNVNWGIFLVKCIIIILFYIFFEILIGTNKIEKERIYSFFKIKKRRE